MATCNTINDIPIIKRMWNEEFGDSSDIISAYINRYLNSTNYSLLIDSVNNEPIGMAHFPQFCNKLGEVGYLYAVTVSPIYRNRGIATTIISQSFHLMYNRGDIMCLTIPASPSLMIWYCERFGFTASQCGATLEFNVSDGFDFGGDVSENNIGAHRIINPLKYIERYYQANNDVSLNISYHDPLLPQNSGKYIVENGQVYFMPDKMVEGLTPQELYESYRIEDNRLNFVEE